MHKGDGGGAMALILLVAAIGGGAVATGVVEINDGQINFNPDALSSGSSATHNDASTGCTIDKSMYCPDSCGSCTCEIPPPTEDQETITFTIDAGQQCLLKNQEF